MEIELVVTLVVVNILMAAVCLVPIWWKYMPNLIGKFRKGTSIKVGHMKLQDNQSWKLDLEDVDTRDAVLEKISTFERKKTNLSRLKEAHHAAANNGTLRKVTKGTVEDSKNLRLFEECFAKAMTKNKIEHSGKTHIANYTKYRYTGSSSRDVEIYHQLTQQWVFYYLMFSTPFEDSSLKCNGVDVTGCNSAETSPMSLRDVFASPEYDDSTTRNNRYSDDYSSSSNSDYSSSSYSSSDSGSSSSYSSSSD